MRNLIQTLKSQSPTLSIILFMGGLLWIAAFWLPAFLTTQGEIKGYWVFATGWMGFTFFQFSWYANLILPVAVMLMPKYPVLSTLVAGFGLLIATQAFWLDSIPGSVENTPVIDLGYGFWLWYASMLLLGLAVMFGSDGTPATTSVSPDSLTSEAKTPAKNNPKS